MDAEFDVETQITNLRDQHPDWMRDFEDTDINIAPRAECQRLLRTAPTPFAGGMVYSVMGMRMQIALVTGTTF